MQPFFQHRPKKVFEIGFGTGIVLYPMVNHIEHFYGIEPSSAGVNRLQAQLQQEGLASKTTLWHAPADKIPNLPSFETDFIIINSVAQYFPSLRYLESVLTESLNRCSAGGHIVLGDVRSAPLDDLLSIDVLLERWRSTSSLNEMTIGELRNQAHRRRHYATELLVDPTFFFDLQRRDPRVTHVEIIPKAFPHNNELSRYRYQVVLHVQSDITHLKPSKWISPTKDDPMLTSLPSLLREFASSDDQSALAIERIPNSLLTWQRRVLEIASDPSTPDVQSLSTLPSADSLPEKGWSAAQLVESGQAHGLSVQLNFSRQGESGYLDAVFLKKSVSGQYVEFPQLRTSSSLLLNRDRESAYQRQALDEKSTRNIMDKLDTQLPKYMIPHALYIVDQIPLTVNGKTDRKVLARVAASDVLMMKRSEPTRIQYKNETERIICMLFAEVLGSTAVTPATDFFALGGHSLLATRLRSLMQEMFKVPIPMHQAFDTPTPAELAMVVEDLKRTKAPLVSAPATTKTVNPGELTDLSYAQFRLWFLGQMNPADHWYHSGFAYFFDCPLDVETMKKTLAEISSRHDILRTIFLEWNGRPKTMVTDQKLDLNVVDLHPSIDLETVKSHLRDFMKLPFNWTVEPPIRATLFQWGQKHILGVSIHHIITDGFSRNVWRHELIELYPALLSGGSSPLPSLPIQYQDYAAWQHSSEHEQLVKEQLKFWRPMLKGSRPARLPKDFEDRSIYGAGGTHIFECDGVLKEKLAAINREHRLTWFMTLMAAFRAVHFQWTGQRDASLGNPIANRHRSELEPLLGFFVNTQVFRLKCHDGMSFVDLLHQTRDLALKVYANQDIPFDKLVEVMRPNRDPRQNPLVEMMFAFQTVETGPFKLAEVPAKLFGVDMKTSRFDLEVHWSERPEALRCVFFYRTDAFRQSTMEKLSQDILDFLATVADNPEYIIHTDKEDVEPLESEVGGFVHQTQSSSLTRF
jgi:hypothetical protein